MKDAHISTLYDENIELSAIIEHLKLQVKEKQHLIETVSENLEVRNASMDFVNDICKEQELQNVKLTKFNEELNHSLSNSKSHNSNLKSSLEELKSSIIQKDFELERLVTAANETSKSIEAKDIRIVSLILVIINLKSNVTELKNDIELLNYNHNGTLLNLNSLKLIDEFEKVQFNLM